VEEPVTDTPRYSLTWLALREGADADARAGELLEPLLAALAGTPKLVIRDLGCGAGSMGRWLARRAPGPQHWIMYDHDPDLLEHAAATMATASADGAGVTVETRCGDLTALSAADLAGASLVTASALLDLLTADEVDRLAAACVQAGCPALLTLSVAGHVDLTPADPLDTAIEAAFNAHQRRRVDGRQLLGPDAADAAAAAFARHGATVRVAPAPWRLGADRAELSAEWLRGWVAAAVDQQPELGPEAAGYLSRRLASARAGELRITVRHHDLLALPE
jgi:trans-aconitate methyltransferase